ncbi:MAG: DMT family transporter [Clostridium sp.]|nr:DMT family transporter [Clostridium sp.]
MLNRRITGILNGAIAAASYGTNPLFALPLFAGGIGVNSVLFYRYAFAVIIYGIWLKLFKKISLNISIKEFFPLMILGIFFSLSSLTLFEAFKYIEAGIACTILFIYPVIVAVIMALFFKEKITKTVITSIILTSIGIALLYKGKPDAALNIHGVIVVLLSALLYALYIVGVKNIKAIQHVNRSKMSFYVMLFGLFVYIVNLKFCTQLQIPHNPLLWFCVVGLALMPTIISLETITISIKLIGSTTTAILGALEPLTAILIGVLIFHESLTLRIITGILLILSGVLLIVTKNTKTRKQKRT